MYTMLIIVDSGITHFRYSGITMYFKRKLCT